ncbi:MAG: NADH-quinone oxidoreductase subunit J [Myxococcales bacterium]|nr:NADH-quinone oxidoreductase subunit J [Myxococcales bacterium]
MSVEVVLFWLFAACTLLSAAVVVVVRSPLSCAISLVGTFFSLAGIYVLLWAHTIAVLQVLVYAGAIMVLFLFVIMLLSLAEVGPGTKLSFSRLLGAGAAVALFAALLGSILKLPVRPDAWAADPAKAAAFGTLDSVGKLLYTSYLLPFEAVSVLLLVAIVGAVVVAKSRI